MAFTSSYCSEGLALVVGYDQVGIHLRYFLCNQSELRRAFRVQLLLVEECDRMERENRFGASSADGAAA
jgi:hypothetical protein